MPAELFPNSLACLSLLVLHLFCVYTFSVQPHALTYGKLAPPCIHTHDVTLAYYGRKNYWSKKTFKEKIVT